MDVQVRGDSQNDKNRIVIHTLTGHSKFVESVAFSPDGKTLASASNDSTVKLWDVSGLTPSLKYNFHGHTKDNPECICFPYGELVPNRKCPVTGHSLHVYCVAFSPDGKTLASASADHTVKLWGVETKECKATLEGHSSHVYSVAFSPDGKTLASGYRNGMIKLWDVKTKECIINLTGHKALVKCVAFSPDGKTLASTSVDLTIKLWDVETEECKGTLAYAAWSVAFSPDGKTLASGSEDDTVKLWNVETQKCKGMLEGHNFPVQFVAFSPVGKTLASGSNDSTVKLWNVETQECKATLTGHSKGVLSVAFSPDGKTLASGSKDSTVKLWNRIPEEQVENMDVERMLAFLMISHGRLSESSVWRGLSDDLIKRLFAIQYLDW